MSKWIKKSELIRVQLEEYPDSRILTDTEAVHEWLDPKNPTTEAVYKSQHEWHMNQRTEDGRYPPDLYTKAEVWNAVHLAHKQWVLNLNRTLAYYLAWHGKQPHIFYECCRQENGMYMYRGLRIGLDPSAYRSGIPSLADA